MVNIGVLLMAYGTPEKLEDVKLYLKDIFGGKEPPESVVAEVTKKYASIGRSPLKDITIRQAELLEKELKTRGLDAEVRVGMRHWKPKLEETAEQLSGRSAGTIIGMVAHPFRSEAGSEGYKKRFMAALKNDDRKFIDDWYRQPKLLDAWEEKINQKLRSLKDDGRDFYLIFASHGLPRSINDKEYFGELEEFTEMAAKRLSIKDYCLAFQNGEHRDWSEPEVSDKIRELSSSGFGKFLLVPIGYLSESLETLYDIDIMYRSFSKEIGVRLERVDCLDVSEKLIKAMADTIIDSVLQT